jgi:hypothetical protein
MEKVLLNEIGGMTEWWHRLINTTGTFQDGVTALTQRDWWKAAKVCLE